MGEVFDPKGWICSKEAAEITGYSRNAILSATNRGNLKSIKIGNMRFYKRKDILEYIQRMKDLGPQRYTPKIHRSPELERETA
ncbi:MAG: helix-turn-helix domain-containing protein [Anaerolineae bacterium]|nr:helix-turn-helix domain-containing protein [Anaerolineae bacterium]